MQAQFYLKQQAKLNASKNYRSFWVFWAIYSSLLYVIIAGYFFTLKEGWKTVALGVGSALFARYVVCEIVDYFYKKQHPYQKYKFRPPTSWLFSFSDERPDAFPSQHALFFTATLPSIWFLSPALGIAALIIVVFISVARIILGYHDFVDVVGGWITGLITGLLIFHFCAPILIK